MPWTLYRYFLRELLKVLLLSTTVLVVVIGFAAAIKPLSDGLLTAMGMVRFVIYSIPTVLGLAMPFAAAFAGTLVFCRLAADNEVLACRASGMSYGVILLPVFTLGLVLTLGVFYLSNSVVPRFYLLAQQQVERDMVNVLVRKIQKRQPVPYRNMVIYADRADDTQTPPQIPGNIQPTRMLVLHGMAVGKLTKEGEIRHECTAEKADVLFFRINGQTVLLMHMTRAMVYDAEKASLLFLERSDFTAPPLPNPFKDRLAFLSYREMQDLAAQPEQFDDVRKEKQSLAEAIASEELARKMEAALQTPRPGLTLLAPGDGQKYVIAAPHVERIKDGLTMSSVGKTPVRIESFAGGSPVRRAEAATATATISVEESDPEPIVKMELQQMTVYDARVASKGAQHKSLLLRGRWPSPLLEPLTHESTNSLVDIGRSLTPVPPAVHAGVEKLVLSKVKLGRKIVAKLHERAASAVSCIWVLLLGAVLSIYLRGQMPLVVYFWSFLLATVAVVIVRTGENVASSPSHTGMIAGGIIIWLGNITLIAAIAAVSLKLSKN